MSEDKTAAKAEAAAKREANRDTIARWFKRITVDWTTDDAGNKEAIPDSGQELSREAYGDHGETRFHPRIVEDLVPFASDFVSAHGMSGLGNMDFLPDKHPSVSDATKGGALAFRARVAIPGQIEKLEAEAESTWLAVRSSRGELTQSEKDDLSVEAATRQFMELSPEMQAMLVSKMQQQIAS